MKKVFSFLLVFAIILSFSLTAFADTPTVPSDESESVIEPRLEEVEWVYRVNNGNLEMRLWSNTYGVWRTDWIIVGPYEG